MSGAVEEGAKVATGVVTALQSTPLVLSLVVFNSLFIAAVVWSSYENRQIQTNLMEKFMEQQNKAMEMLYRCVPPGKDTHFIPIPPERPAELGPPNRTVPENPT